MAKKKNKDKQKQVKEKKKKKFDLDDDVMKGVWGIVLIAAAVFLLISFAGKGGVAGEVTVNISRSLMGWGMYVLPLALAALSFIFFTARRRNVYYATLLAVFLFFSSVLGLLALTAGEEDIARGGYWGYAVIWPLQQMLGVWGTIIALIAVFAASILIGFNLPVSKFARNIRRKRAEEKEEGAEKLAVRTMGEAQPKQREGSKGEARGEKEKREGGQEKEERAEMPEESTRGAAPQKSFVLSDFRLPPTELLEGDSGKPTTGDLVAHANMIKRTLQNFGLEVEMAEVNVGPAVTQFTLRPAEGIKLSRITALSNDLALALAAHPLRIEAPVPGRPVVGIEIPNRSTAWVRLRNLLEDSLFDRVASNLTLALGRDVAGAPVYGNLAKMPHLLIAGSTGSGKTIGLNAIILSLLYQNSPELLRFVLIDPKRVEFNIYSDIPHLLSPVIVDSHKTINALKWLVQEMERRFDALSEAKARDIENYNSNKKIVQEKGALPYIVVVIDELADIMAAKGKEAESLIVRIAQMARAVGIHLVLATQRPSVDVITGLIKANITARIAFQVASQVDSRTVLDMAGAEKLLGSGDMLYIAPERSKPRRVQGPYIQEKEVRRVVGFLADEAARVGEDVALESFTSSPVSGKEQLDFEELDESDDELYEEARKTVLHYQRASASLLQRRLRIGYARAARLIDLLEERGVIGPGEGAKPRDVYNVEDKE